jgi:hypothetical protein
MFAPQQYFDFFRLTRVQIHVVPTPDGSSAASHQRVNVALSKPSFELWLLL